jgi:Potential Queuosine, Q, salvage protein family
MRSPDGGAQRRHPGPAVPHFAALNAGYSSIDMDSLFTKIRDSCAEVAANARWVAIDHAAIAPYAETLAPHITPLAHTAEHHLLGRGDDTLAFFVILDSINFGSGYSPHLKRNGPSGYFTIAKRLKKHCEAHGIPTAAELTQWTAQDCARVFDQDLANPHAQELMWLFALALNGLGAWAVDQHGGDCLGFLRRAKRTEEAVAALLAMRFFRDVATYGDREVPFLKRAQILVHDLKIAAPAHPLLAFDDLAKMTIFADNIVPFVLRADAVLRYDDWLDRRIQNGELIGSGSCEEIEMRACAVHAAELLRAAMVRAGRSITAREIDQALWDRGQEIRGQVATRPHLTRCTYY